MIISGLTGGIGHGKTTFANLLAAQSKSAVHFETWELVAEVATALRIDNGPHPAPQDIAAINQWLQPLADIANLHTHVNLSFNDIRITDERLAEHPEYYARLFEYLQAVQADPTLATVEISDSNKQSFRQLLQWLGGYLVVAAGSGVWYDEIVRRIAHLRSSGCDLVTVGGVRYPADAERLRNAGGVIIEIMRPNLPQQDVRDLTERERNLIEADSIITNNGTLEQLAACAKQVHQDLSLRQLQRTYIAQPLQAV